MCQQFNMTLATIKTLAIKDLIKEFMIKKTKALDYRLPEAATWLGANDLEISRTLAWSDGEVIVPEANTWFDRVPSNDSTKRCVSLVNFEFYKEDCSRPSYYLCERRYC